MDEVISVAVAVGGQVAVGGFADRSVALLQRHQRDVGVGRVGFDDGELGWFQRDRRVVGVEFDDRSVGALLQRHQRVVGVVGFDDGEFGWFQRDRRVVGGADAQ